MTTLADHARLLPRTPPTGREAGRIRFPARHSAESWPATCQTRDAVWDALTRAPYRGGQRPHAEDPPQGADVSAGLVGRPAGPDLAGTVAGQRGRRRRRGMAHEPGPMAAAARPGRRLAARCAGLGATGGDQRRSRSPRAGLAGGQGNRPRQPGTPPGPRP